MALQTRIATVNMISVHEEEDLIYSVPNVIPGTFLLPPITWTSSMLQTRAKVAVRPQGSSAPERIQYARRHDLNGGNVIILKIPEASTFRYGTEKQTHDEYGGKMFPDIERAQLYVKPEQVANDIERAFGQMGVIAIVDLSPEGIPTTGELKRARDAYKAWMIKRINDTNKTYAQHGFAEVTKQTLLIVNRCYRDHLIPALPPWAAVDPNVGMAAGTSSCEVCHGVLLANDVKCGKCGAIHDWYRAVQEFGLIREADVPKMKRKEAGLEGPVDRLAGPPAALASGTIGSLADSTAVALVSKDGAIKSIPYGMPDEEDASFGGEARTGRNDPEKVVDSIVQGDDEPETVNARTGRSTTFKRK